ncbi:MAG: DUF1592 domain-containing protein [Planctomycetota bacterium]|nr:MAG: DUF1592 domain-containing protein [Planctomycetota bacterium]
MPVTRLTVVVLRWITALNFAVVGLGLGAPISQLDAEDQTGEQIYKERCTVCHGPNGAGSSEAPSPLQGDRSVKELTKFIHDTMPKDEPELCVGADAEKVAAYIHETFYSPLAQERERPARIEFSRLTVRQYEEAIADLISSFSGAAEWSTEQGLKAEYFKEKRMRKEDRLIERIDPRIDFSFGENPPGEGINKEEFSIQWHGSLRVPETGMYDLMIETENAAKLFLNDQDLVDAMVRSGDQKEYVGSTRLLGGRRYELRLEFKKSKEKTASLRLKWRPPHRVWQVIPEQYLSPQGTPRTLVVTTPFPPDDRSRGFERGNAISPEWNEATTLAALEVANALTDRIDEIARTKADDPERVAKLKKFCSQFATRAFRRPLTEEDQRFYVDHHFETASIPDTAARRSLTLVLKSPRFLYRELNVGEFDDLDVASWLSFTLWDSIPDQPLLDAAQRGQLKTREQIQQQAQRMVRSPRCRAKLHDFGRHWLRLDHHPELTKDPVAFPEFTVEVVTDLRTSLDLTLDEFIEREAPDVRELFAGQELLLNGRLAKIYGVDLPVESAFQKVTVTDRRGVLSHPLILACLAYDKATSPIHRGVFVSRSLLGRQLKTPPVAVAPLAPDLHADLTTRERVELQTSPPVCQTCHTLINPLGYTLEGYDAMGRVRTTEQGRPINSSGAYIDRAGTEFSFSGSQELAAFLVNSPESHESFVTQLFHHLAKQPVRALGNDFLGGRVQAYREAGYDLRKLTVDLATESALRLREAPGSAQP